MKTIDKILTNCDCKYGSPMGRADITPDNLNYIHVTEKNAKRYLKSTLFDCKVNLTQGYDKGGAYWGLPNNLRVKYTKDLTYVVFYRNY
jgi:hypothetical protein